MTQKISFAITTHNEGQYIQDLLNQLIPFCLDSGDEIVIVDDYSTEETTVRILEEHRNHDIVKIFSHELMGNFAEHKNYLTSKCTGEYIFQVDADETINPDFLDNLHSLLELNPEADLFWVPRVNVVSGLTADDVARWNWRVDYRGWVMFPDYQSRLYKNKSHISWKGKVHEQISGYGSFLTLPAEEEWSLYHIKTIDRQREQNTFYETLQ